MNSFGRTSRRVSFVLATISCLYACGDQEEHGPLDTTGDDMKGAVPDRQCSDDHERLETTDDDMRVIVPEHYRGCDTDNDCVLASTSCNGCCERDALTKSLEAQFDCDRTETCADYVGPICDCSFAKIEARCEKKQCVTVPMQTD